PAAGGARSRRDAARLSVSPRRSPPPGDEWRSDPRPRVRDRQGAGDGEDHPCLRSDLPGVPGADQGAARRLVPGLPGARLRPGAPARRRPGGRGMRRRAARLLLAAGLLAPIPPVPAQTPLKDAYLKRFVGAPAPPLVLKDVRGGRVGLLNFWYSACGPCRMETPDLIALYQAYKERGLVVLGVNTDPLIMPDDHGEMLRRFIDTYRIPYPVLVADRKVYEDYGRTP